MIEVQKTRLFMDELCKKLEISMAEFNNEMAIATKTISDANRKLESFASFATSFNQLAATLVGIDFFIVS